LTVEDCIKIIKPRMGEKRFIHSVNVSAEAVRLSQKYGANAEKAAIAGMLHDVTKETPLEEQLQIIKDNGIILSNVQKSAPKLWHAISGYIYIKTILGINDTEILDAVRYHTTGRENMSLLEKVVFVADFIGAERDYDGVEKMRKKAEKGLEEAMLFGTSFSIKDLLGRNLTVDPNTVALYNELVLNK